MNISYKWVTYVTLLLFIGLGVLFLISSWSLSVPLEGGVKVGPAYFPRVISILLIICCIISLLKTMRAKDKKSRLVRIPELHHFIPTVLFSIIFLWIWDNYGNFYLISFIFLAALFYIYNPNKNLYRRTLISVATSFVIVTFLAYVVFGRLLGVTF